MPWAIPKDSQNGEGRKALGEHAFIDLYEHLLNRASAKVSAKHLQWSPFVKPLLRLAQPSARPLRITEDGHRLIEDAPNLASLSDSSGDSNSLRERRCLRVRAGITTT